MQIVNLDSTNQEWIKQTANLLVVGFENSWPDLSSALVEVHDCLHPYEFYQKAGFVIVGMIPDANGFGKPDIIMAKRVK